MQTITLAIRGMTCNGCRNGVEKLLQAQSGVANASVNLARNSATITAAEGVVLLPKDLITAVKNKAAKYDAWVLEDPFENAVTTAMYIPYLWRAGLALLIAVPLFVLSLLGVLPALTLLARQVIGAGLAVVTLGNHDLQRWRIL